MFCLCKEVGLFCDYDFEAIVCFVAPGFFSSFIYLFLFWLFQSNFLVREVEQVQYIIEVQNCRCFII